MNKRNSGQEENNRLRQKAEERLKLKKQRPNETVSEADLQKLIHELQVHQIELELQNEELVIAKEKAQRAEEKYADLYDFAPSGLLSVSRDGEISELNFAAANLLGKERSRLINSLLNTYISNETLSVFNTFLQKVLTKKTKQFCEVIVKSKGNFPKYVNIEGIIDRNDELCNLNVIDITDRKRYEAELLISKEKAEESDRLKSAFLANMSHEIRTPMNGIIGFAQLLSGSDIKGEDQQKYIKIIENSGERMLHIINQIIDISKIESGMEELNIQSSNINELIRNIDSFFKPEAELKKIKLSLKIPLSNNEATIKTDHEKVSAILINLVKNALKFTQKGSIELGYTPKKQNDQFELEFYVKDTGVGIRKDLQEQMFERFIQAKNEKILHEGTGLGLAITKSYVEMLGGKIWLESEVGKGSTFFFTLPYLTVPDPQNLENKPAASGIANKIKKLKILIAEDDEVSKILLDEIIKTIGKEMISARTGVEAVEICRTNPDIDLILMDIRMPILGGYQATRQIREFNKDVIIIAQTAYGLEGDREKSKEAGCSDYISKPINKTKLLGLIQKYFGI